MMNRTTLVLLGLAFSAHNTAFAEEAPPPSEQPAEAQPEAQAEDAPSETDAPAPAPAPAGDNAEPAEAAEAPEASAAPEGAQGTDNGEATEAANANEAAEGTDGTENAGGTDGTEDTENADGTENAEGTDGTEDADSDAATAEAPAPPAQTATETKDTDHSDGHSGGHSAFTVEEMWTQSSGPVRAVLLMLLVMLIGSMGVAIERFLYLGAAKKQSLALASEIGGLLKSGNPEKALEISKDEAFEKSYFAHQVTASLTEFTQFKNHFGIESTERAIEKHSVSEDPLLRKGFGILATTGSTAPFVGLVGTIFGIINAFGQIGAEGGADLTTLAPAIGEALITTAFGIIVAIVGVWLFNYFTAVIDGITNDMSVSAQEILDWCHKTVESKDNAAK
ncbi:MAG: MotA/TolQ/ExbB proton channel family protein [Myxococcota bacterium]